MIARITLILALALIPALAVAQIIPISANRYVEANFEVYNSSTDDFYNDGDYQEAFGYDDFDAQVAPFVNFMDTYVDVNSDQISTISPTVLQAYLSSAGWSENLDPDVDVQVYTYSVFEVEFELATAHDFFLSGSGYAEGPNIGYIDLWDEFGAEVYHYEVSWDNTDFIEVGTLPAGTYTLSADTAHEIFIDGEGGDGGEISLDVALEVTPASSPVGDSVANNYLTAGPNPMSNSTNIAFAVGRDAPVTLEVLDVRGRRVRTFETAGRSEGVVLWDGRTDNGSHAPSGTYFLRARSGAEVLQSKVTLVR